MEKTIKLYLPESIETQKDTIRQNNAFILSNGNFMLAKGYTGCNPSHQLESSALQVSRNLTNVDLIQEYNTYIQQNNLKKLYYIRTMLVQYYGMALFARTEYIHSKDSKRFFDYSLVPNPKYYNKEATSEQIATLRQLFILNDEDTIFPNHLTSEENFQRVLRHEKSSDNWHRLF